MIKSCLKRKILTFAAINTEINLKHSSMKRNLLISFAIILGLAFMSACNSGNSSADLKTREDSIAYVIGANIGTNLKQNIERDSLSFTTEALVQGFKDALNGLDSTVFTADQKAEIMNSFQKDMQQKQMDKMSQAAQPNKEAGAKWLEENKKKEGVVVTASGLQYKVIKAGNGATPTANDNVTVHYEGKLIDGKIFDSSYERKEPATFQLTNVIPGFQEGIMLMKEGATYELYIPSDLGYGDQGSQGIPGGSTLIFKVELIKVAAPAAQGK